jgi:eukaryotic-like serine/threonine-protein kinase
MASIYRATDLRDNRVVALKIPHPDLEADPILFDRFSAKPASAKSSTTPR